MGCLEDFASGVVVTREAGRDDLASITVALQRDQVCMIGSPRMMTALAIDGGENRITDALVAADALPVIRALQANPGRMVLFCGYAVAGRAALNGEGLHVVATRAGGAELDIEHLVELFDMLSDAVLVIP
jgi:hypothetical protein